MAEIQNLDSTQLPCKAGVKQWKMSIFRTQILATITVCFAFLMDMGVMRCQNLDNQTSKNSSLIVQLTNEKITKVH